MSDETQNPPLWAPNLRRVCAQFCSRMDNRKTREASEQWEARADDYYLAQYSAWWNAVGWSEGADNPDVTMMKLRARRKAEKLGRRLPA